MSRLVRLPSTSSSSCCCSFKRRIRLTSMRRPLPGTSHFFLPSLVGGMQQSFVSSMSSSSSLSQIPWWRNQEADNQDTRSLGSSHELPSSSSLLSSSLSRRNEKNRNHAAAAFVAVDHFISSPSSSSSSSSCTAPSMSAAVPSTTTRTATTQRQRRNLSSSSAATAPPTVTEEEVVITSSSSTSSHSDGKELPRLLQDDPEVVLRECGVTADDLWHWAQKKPTPLRLADMYRYAANPDFRIPNAVFLHTELPIRVAQRAVDLLTLPFGLSEARPIRQVASTYIRYWHTILSTPVPQTRAQEEQFTQVLQSLVLDRFSIPHAIAKGLAIWQSQGSTKTKRRDITATDISTYRSSNNNSNNINSENDNDPERYHEMEEALYRFFTARVGLRFLTEHHVLSRPASYTEGSSLSMSNAQSDTHSSSSDIRRLPSALRQVVTSSILDPDEHDQAFTVGCIQSHVDLAKEVRRVVALVREECAEEFGVDEHELPAIEIVDCQPETKRKTEFTYVPHHLHYMLLELLKNSMRATMRYHGSPQSSSSSQQPPEYAPPTLPPIRVVMSKGDEDITIKVADKAGGIPRSRMAQIWKFAHSSIPTHSNSNPSDQNDNDDDVAVDDDDHTNASGAQLRGFGLPITRIYARYFGGELTLKSMEGYGLDAYLHLPRLGKSGEHLPHRVRASPGEGDSMPAPSSLPSYAEYGDTGSTARTNRSTSFRQYSTIAEDWQTRQDNEIRQILQSVLEQITSRSGWSLCTKEKKNARKQKQKAT